MLDQNEPTLNNNTAGLSTGVSFASKLRRSVLHFDISDLPAGATINSAYMEINCISASFIALEGSVHRLTQPGWVETEASWDDYASGVSWGAAGGDFDVVAEATFTQPLSNGVVQTGDITDLITDAITSRSSQLHVLIKQNNEFTTGGFYTYSDREFEDVFGGIYPRIVVDYTVESSGQRAGEIPTDDEVDVGAGEERWGAIKSEREVTISSYDGTFGALPSDEVV